MRYYVHLNGTRFEVDVDGESVCIDGTRYALDLGSTGSGIRSVLLGDASHRTLGSRTSGGRWTVSIDGVPHQADVLDPGQEAVRVARRAAAVDAGPTPLRAPMPGLVIRVEVAPGDSVAAGDGLLIVEAMKMENELKAAAPGRVGSILVKEGDTVERDQVLVEFEREEE